MSDILRASAPAPVAPLSIRPDRPTARYCRGEAATFVITPEGGPLTRDYDWTITKDQHDEVASGTLAAGQTEAVVVQATLNEPGFLRCTILWSEEKRVSAAVGFEPEAIAPSLPPPDDFDAFWQGKIHDDTPLQPRLKPIDAPDDSLEAIDFQADSAGGQISGYLVKPKGAAPGSLPAIIVFHGAGLISARMEVAALWASRGFLAIDLNAHGVPNGLSDEHYRELLTGPYSDFRTRGNDSRESTYFLGLFRRALRGLDFLTAQPEWDGRTLIAYGSSMGAAQSITVSALDPRVTFTVAAVPAMCDHTGRVANRCAGWPQWVPFDEEGNADAARLEAARYYDMMNMARKLRDSFFVIGWADTVCPPTSIYAMVNQAGGRKAIFDDYPSLHENTPAAVEQMRQAVMAHVQRS